MSDPASRPLKRKADTEFNNHGSVHNQAVNQNVHGSQYFGSVNFYNNGPAHEPGSATNVNSSSPIRLSDILASLAFPGMLDRRDGITQPFLGTCTWIFDHEKYLNWKKSTRSLLWIKGKPGSGKSTLMSFLHQQLRQERFTDEEIYLDFFFSARGAELQRTPFGMLRALLNQVLLQCPSAGAAVMDAYRQKCDTYGGYQIKWEWQQSELERLFADTVIAASQQRQTTIFVDALDEAGEQAAQYTARYFHRISDRGAHLEGNGIDVNLRLCFSSRHYPIVSTVKGSEIWMEEHNGKDIALLVDKELISGSFEDDDSCDAVQLKKRILEQANGVFQWVCLVLPLLSSAFADGFPEDAETHLKSLPQGLENMYSHIVTHVLKLDYISQSYLLFQWACLAERPLSTYEMMYAMASSQPLNGPPRLKISDDAVRKRIKALSGGMVEVVYLNDDQMKMRKGKSSAFDDDAADVPGHEFYDVTGNSVDVRIARVQVIHQTVKDFLVTRGFSMLSHRSRGPSIAFYPPSEDISALLISQSHSTLYWCCLNYFASLDLRCLISPDEAPLPWKRAKTIMDDRSAKQDILARFPFLEYASNYMFTHLRQSSTSDVTGTLQSLGQEHEIRLLERIRLPWVTELHRPIRALTSIPFSIDASWSLLHLAAAFGSSRLVKSLIDFGYSFTSETNRRIMPIHLACKEGHVHVCEILFKAGAKLTIVTDYMHSPLYLAASGGYIGLVSWLLDNGALTKQSADEGVLQAAVQSGNAAVVEILLNAEAGILAEGDTYKLSLWDAVQQGNPKLIELLLNAGANASIMHDLCGSLVAVDGESSLEVTKLFLAAGANVNAQGGVYGNALQAAIVGIQRRPRRITPPMTYINLDENNGENAPQVATIYDGVPDMVRMLLDARADVNAQGGIYGNALQAAARSSDLTVVKMLLDAGANVNAIGGEYGSALQAGAASGDVGVVKALLDAGADVNVQGGRYVAALQAAAAGSNNLEMVQVLISAGANVNSRDERGNAFQTAATSGNLEVMQALLDAGFEVDDHEQGYVEKLHAAQAKYKRSAPGMVGIKTESGEVDVMLL